MVSLNKLKTIFFQQSKSLVIKNYSFLLLLKGFDYIAPLITLPYLTRILGVEKYGFIVFAKALIQYAVMFTDYGFNFSATRDVARYKDDPEKISEIWNAIFIIKFIITFIVGILLVIVVESFRRFSSERLVYYIMFIGVIGNDLFPTWLYQGMENMKFITIRNVMIKIIFILCMFIFIKKQSDYLMFPVLNTLGFLFAGFMGMLFAQKTYKINWQMMPFNIIKDHFFRAWHVFLSSMLMTIYGASGTLILGLMTNNTIVGYYSVAIRIVMAIQGVFSPLQQALYPYFGRNSHLDKQGTVKKLSKLLFYTFLVGFICSVTGVLFSKPVIVFISGSKYLNSIPIMQILSITIFSYMVNNVIAIQGFMNFELTHLVSKVAFSAMLAFLIFTPIFIYYFQAIGLAFSFAVVEMGVVVLNMFYFNKYIDNRYAFQA
jgi:PST family polysaccharide transporter